MSHSGDKSYAHAGHRRRLRGKIRSAGIDGMADVEILEFLLCYAVPKQDVRPLALRLLTAFGTLARVLDAGEDELRAVCGVGEAVARALGGFRAVMRACAGAFRSPIAYVATPDSAVRAARFRFVDPAKQEAVALCTAPDGELLSVSLRDWDGLIAEEALRWLLGIAVDSRARHFTVVWKRRGELRPLSNAEADEVYALLQLLAAADLCLDDLILLYRDGKVSLREAGVLSGAARLENVAIKPDDAAGAAGDGAR